MHKSCTISFTPVPARVTTPGQDAVAPPHPQPHTRSLSGSEQGTSVPLALPELPAERSPTVAPRGSDFSAFTPSWGNVRGIPHSLALLTPQLAAPTLDAPQVVSIP